MRRALSMVMASVVLAAGLVGVGSLAAPDRAEALSGSGFDPGNIISDSVFYDGRAMDEGAVQAFLDRMVGGCRNGACLDVLKVSTSSRGADAMCGAYQGAASEPVSRIIAKVGAACGINPQVLLVTLQKEQSLVQGSTAQAPSAARLERAMGYACPDSANGGCDPAYAGVYNQLYRAAWQFKRYGNPPGTSTYFTWFAPGGVRNVQYSPDPACGTRPVSVQNAATAALYYYTPYTPNSAALTNLYGTGDRCSAYGNRNFWVYFTTWFGTTTKDDPFGGIDARQFGPGAVQVGGWAIDPNTKDPIGVRWYSDGRLLGTLPADASRPDVGRAYPGFGDSHGIKSTLTVGPGLHRICGYGVNVGPGKEALLGTCQSVEVRSGSPFGGMDASAGGPGRITVRGWTIDPDTTRSARVDVYVDDVLASRAPAGAPRPDVGRVHPAYGDSHGIDVTFTAAAGQRRVCAYALDEVAPGAPTLLGCQTVTVADTSPFGGMDVTTSGSTVQVNGWTIDPDTTGPVQVRTSVDGVVLGTTAANGQRPDVGRAYPAFGPAHGIVARHDLVPGSHRVCVTAVNVGGGRDVQLGCATAVVGASSSPLGGTDASSASAGTVRVQGWTFDPDQPRTSLRVDTYVDGVGVASGPAEVSRPDVARVHPAAGPLHGIDRTVAVRAGSRTVCSYAINVGAGSTVLLGCEVVTVR